MKCAQIQRSEAFLCPETVSNPTYLGCYHSVSSMLAIFPQQRVHWHSLVDKEIAVVPGTFAISVGLFGSVFPIHDPVSAVLVLQVYYNAPREDKTE